MRRFSALSRSLPILLCSALAAGLLTSCGPSEDTVGERQRNFLGDGEVEVILTPPSEEGEGDVIVIRPVEEAEYETSPTVVAPPELPTTGTIPPDLVPNIRDTEHLLVLAERLADLWPPRAALACFADESQRQEIISNKVRDVDYLDSLLKRAKQLRSFAPFNTIRIIREKINNLNLRAVLEECPPQKPSESVPASSPTDSVSTPTSPASVTTPNDSPVQEATPTSVAGKVATESAATPTTVESSPTTAGATSATAGETSTNAGATSTSPSATPTTSSEPVEAGDDKATTQDSSLTTEPSLTTDQPAPQQIDSSDPMTTDTAVTQSDDTATELPDDSDSSTLVIVMITIAIALFLLVLFFLMRRRRKPE